MNASFKQEYTTQTARGSAIADTKLVQSDTNTASSDPLLANSFFFNAWSEKKLMLHNYTIYIPKYSLRPSRY